MNTPEDIKRKLEELRQKKSVTARELLPVMDSMLLLLSKQQEMLVTHGAVLRDKQDRAA
jgi:hypothetical protein